MQPKSGFNQCPTTRQGGIRRGVILTAGSAEYPPGEGSSPTPSTTTSTAAATRRMVKTMLMMSRVGCGSRVGTPMGTMVVTGMLPTVPVMPVMTPMVLTPFPPLLLLPPSPTTGTDGRATARGGCARAGTTDAGTSNDISKESRRAHMRPHEAAKSLSSGLLRWLVLPWAATWATRSSGFSRPTLSAAQ